MYPDTRQLDMNILQFKFLFRIIRSLALCLCLYCIIVEEINQIKSEIINSPKLSMVYSPFYHYRKLSLVCILKISYRVSIVNRNCAAGNSSAPYSLLAALATNTWPAYTFFLYFNSIGSGDSDSAAFYKYCHKYVCTHAVAPPLF